MKLHIIAILVSASSSFGYPQQSSAPPTPEQYQQEESRVPREPNFYPSFPAFHTPPLGHSRPFFYQQEAAYSQRPVAGFQDVGYDAPRFSGYKESGHSARGLLGSGNFGVIPGGTFYDKDSQNYDREYSNYYRNGHGRPAFRGQNPKPYNQFENFKDFADINTPSAFSHFVVVYVNKNGTKAQSAEQKPKNIIESLALLDLESPPKKPSKAKAKLAKLKPEKKHRKTGKSRDLHEPLLALS